MTFNIAHGRGVALFQFPLTKSRSQAILDKIAAMIKLEKPDIIALQEVDQNSWWNGRFNQAAYLAKKAGYPYYRIGLNCKGRGWFSLNYGNAILSRYPIARSENNPFGPHKLGQKGFLFCEIQTPHYGLLPVVSIHLDYKTSKNRVLQAKQVVNFFKKKKSLPFLMGDFNSNNTQGEGLTYILNHLRYTKREIYPQKGNTFSIYYLNKRLDHILVPPGWKGISCSILSARLSDHLPVLVDVEPESRKN